MISLRLLVALTTLAYIGAAHADGPMQPLKNNSTVGRATMFPFVLPPFDHAQTSTDVSWMNVVPAGANGFIRTRGEHFVDGKGNIVRFWGVNLNFHGVFPPKDQASAIAGRLAKFGFNSVRIHHFEGNAAPNGIWKAAGIGSSRLKMPREFDADQLDRFDFFMSELMKRGIYININLHVGRKVQVEEGFTHAASLPDKDKGVNYYDRKLIEAQKDFTRQILTHVNPYTGRSYANEPGVCAVEIANENSLLGMWLDGSFATKIPAHYQQPLRDKWNAWLRANYTESTLRAAWTELDDPLDRNDVLALPYPPGIVNPNSPDARVIIGSKVLRDFKPKTDSGAVILTDLDSLGGPTINGSVRPGLGILFRSLGNEKWGFQLNRDGLNLQSGQPYTLTFWARTNAPRRISINLWKDKQPFDFLGFTGFADLTSEWQQYSFVFRPGETDPNSTRLNFNFGSSLGAVQFGEVELKAGGRLAAPPNWTLANGVPLIELRTTQVWNARRDFAKFLGEVESSYVAEMKGFLQNDLQVKVPIWNTQAQFGGWAGIWREKDSDAIDVHAYWKHPIFEGNAWTSANWRVENASMTAAAGIDPLSGFSFYRVKGKPFVMSEWNSGQPNDFGSESLLMIAGYAAWQDWAGIWLFDYHSSGSFDRDHFRGFFSIDTHPAKMATAPAAALLFRRPQETQGTSPLPGDALAAQREYTLTVPPEFLWLKVASSSGQPTPALVLPIWRDAGVARGAPLRGKAYVQFGDAPLAVANRSDRDPRNGAYLSDTRQVRWNTQPAYFSVNTPRSKVATGFLGGYRLTLGELRLNVPAVGNRFATIALSSMDNEPVAQSKRLLLTAVGKAENRNMGWNAARNSVGNAWGDGPTQVEGISSQVQILTDQQSVKVYVLSPTGVRASQVPSTLRRGVLQFSIAPTWRTVWYEIAAD